eukprot:CAMPEP_0118857152 /NCGR_PEP_ID=MMETSP1163-20130328/4369_1 /TAXON_ID=124430 /ORGANISM="Phaeomonas parva, Strain CCMP2877" /LENGTH=178 /DNA_ID=CAMNT_0006790411 /DNA_START=524 /DNA_END=1061 /DNA_ORIENTATION=-
MSAPNPIIEGSATDLQQRLRATVSDLEAACGAAEQHELFVRAEAELRKYKQKIRVVPDRDAHTLAHHELRERVRTLKRDYDEKNGALGEGANKSNNDATFAAAFNVVDDIEATMQRTVDMIDKTKVVGDETELELQRQGETIDEIEKQVDRADKGSKKADKVARKLTAAASAARRRYG